MLLAHFTLLIPVVTSYEAVLVSLPMAYRWVYIILLFYTLYTIGAALENKPGALSREIVRCLLVACALLAGASTLPGSLASWSVVYLVISAVLMILAIRKSNPPDSAQPEPGEVLANN